MKATALQYATALSELVTERPSDRKRIMKKFGETLARNGDEALAKEIVAHVEKLLATPALQNPIESKDKKGGVRIRKGDTLVDNTVARRIARLREAVN